MDVQTRFLADETAVRYFLQQKDPSPSLFPLSVSGKNPSPPLSLSLSLQKKNLADETPLSSKGFSCGSLLLYRALLIHSHPRRDWSVRESCSGTPMTGDEVVLEMEPELMNVIWVELGGLDLICIPKDCCDGNDEYDGKVKCPNTCWEAGKVARDKLKKKIWRCTGRTGGQWSNRGRIFEKLFGIQA